MKSTKKRSLKDVDNPSVHSFVLIAGALVWAAAIFLLHVKYVSEQIPIRLIQDWAALQSELVAGPNLFNFWLSHLLRFTAGISFFAGAWAVGQCVLRRFTTLTNGGAPQPLISLFSLGIGLGIFANAAFVLLAMGIAQKWLLITLYCSLCAYGGWRVLKLMNSDQVSSHPQTISPSSIERIVFIGVLLGVMLAFIGTTCPEIFYDALVYHLAVPQAYLQAGRIIDMPYTHHSYLPLLTSLLYFWGLAVGGMFSAKLVNFFLGISILWGIYSWGKILKNSELGMVAAAFFISTPIVLYLFWVTGSELGMAFFLLLAIISYWHWVQMPEKNPQFIYLSALFSGLALACKYTAILGVVGLTLSYIRTLFRNTTAIKPTSLLLYALFVILPLLPWWGRNYVFTGNPFTPYLMKLSETKNMDPDLMRSWNVEAQGGTPGLSPVRHIKKIFDDSLIGFQVVPSNYVGPLFLAFLPFIFFTFETRIVRWGCVFFFSIYLAGLSATYVTRFLIPYFVLLCILCAFGIEQNRSKLFLKRGIYTIFMGALLFNLYLVSKLFFISSTGGLQVATGRVTPADYLKVPRNGYPNPSYSAYEYIGQLKLRPKERILVSGDPRVYYSPNLTIANGPQDIPVLFWMASNSGDPDDLNQKLDKQHVRVLLVNRIEGQRIDSPKYVTERSLQLIAVMLDRYFDKLYEDPWTTVYGRKSDHFLESHSA